MNLDDQAEYMTIHSHFENKNSFGLIPQFLGLIHTMDCDGKKALEILKIIGTYVGNNFETGLYIQISRFNHSFKPNAVNSKRQAIENINQRRYSPYLQFGMSLSIILQQNIF